MMKRNHSYEINHLNNTVTITRTFLEKASQISSEEFSLYRRFQEMGFAICLQTRRTRKKDENKEGGRFHPFGQGSARAFG